jgi:acylphosphatase
MVQVEIFSAGTSKKVQDDFNEWIENENPDIVETKVSESNDTYTLWVFYRI